MPEPPSLLDAFESDRRKTAATVDTNYTLHPFGTESEEIWKRLGLFCCSNFFLASQPHQPNSLATSKRWAGSLGQALRGSA